MTSPELSVSKGAMKRGAPRENQDQTYPTVSSHQHPATPATTSPVPVGETVRPGPGAGAEQTQVKPVQDITHLPTQTTTSSIKMTVQLEAQLGNSATT